MSLVKHGMHLSEDQVRRLIKGQAVMMKHAHLTGGGVDVFLTPRQATKVAKFHSMGKGMRLQMSERQIHHNIKGSGAFSWIKDKLKQGLNKVIEVVKPHLPAARHKLTEKAREILHTGVGRLADKVGSHHGVDIGALINKYGKAGAERILAEGNSQAAQRGYGLPKGRKYSKSNPNQANEGPIGITTIGPNIVPSQLPLVPHNTGRGRGQGSGLYA